MTTFLIKVLDFFTQKKIYVTIFTILIAYIIYKAISLILIKGINKGKNAYERKKRITIINLFVNITKYLIIILAALTILNIYGVNIKAMVAGLGITATILGLALQDTFKDIINGINIIMENYFIVGDVVTYNNFTGTVQEFGLKSTKIRNVNGEVLMVANRNIMEIKNLSQKEQKVLIDVNVAYEEDTAKVEKIIKDKILPQIEKIENVKKNSTIYLGIDELADSAIKYLIQFECERDTQWQAQRDANKIILVELSKANIKIPYPQMEVHNEK